MSEEPRRRRRERASEPPEEENPWTRVVVVGLVTGIGLMMCCPLGVFSLFVLRAVPDEQKTHGPAEVTVTAVKMCAEYRDNESAANSMYRNKVVEITGRVARVRDGCLYLETGVGFIGGVNLRIYPRESKVLATLKHMQDVRVTGICRGRSPNDILVTVATVE